MCVMCMLNFVHALTIIGAAGTICGVKLHLVDIILVWNLHT